MVNFSLVISPVYGFKARNIKETIKKLTDLNIELKILTGDNALVAKNICE